MIVSASRRTDIPAFYSEWFMNRIRAGACLVPNPFNRAQVSRISLAPEDVDAIVFWTRNPHPLLPHLAELDGRGYRYYFLVTLMANPRRIDPGSPSLDAAVAAFTDLSGRIGPKRVVWRYDPVFLTGISDASFHIAAYRRIAAALKGYTVRSISSIMHPYRKTRKRISELASQGIDILPTDEESLSSLMGAFAEISSENGMEIHSCADELDLRRYGIMPGKCIDDGLISEVFGRHVEGTKDPCQRKACGCAPSRDIGMYDSCPAGCIYCYAVASFERAKANHERHDPLSESLL